MAETNYVGDFAIIAEGPTDQIVLRAILNGFFDQADDLRVNDEQPRFDETASKAGHIDGGWTRVVHYFEAKKYLQALQLNRYLVVQIDTDVAGDLGVPRGELSAEQHVNAIRDHVVKLINGAAPLDRFLFAIAVDEIECWLLPLVFDRSEKAKTSKQTGCLEALNERRRQENASPLSKSDGKGKELAVYREISKPLSKKRKALEVIQNPGFAHFMAQLDALGWTPPST